VTTNMTRFYGRAPRGQRLVCKVPFGAWKTMTFIAALRHDRLTAPMLLEGPMTGQSFIAYIDQVLAPTLRCGDIVIMDNVPTHRVRGVREALRSRGVLVPEFPPYSPDLNPIEQSFAKLKALLRKAGARSLHRLSTEIAAALKQFPAAECAAFLAHDGYGQPNRKTV
jgi:transposase